MGKKPSQPPPAKNRQGVVAKQDKKGQAVPPDPETVRRHQAAQRLAHQAEGLRTAAFPAMMATALGLDGQFEPAAYRVYLERLMADLGSPTDPVERMMAEQLCLAHFRTAQLHAAGGRATGAEAVKLLNAAAARLLAEFRRTALALRELRNTATSKRSSPLKVYRTAN